MRELRDEQVDRGVSNALQAAFARYIQRHEDPPVDPVSEVLGDAIAMAAGNCVFSVDDVLLQSDGKDNREFIARLRAELSRRGLELAKREGE